MTAPNTSVAVGAEATEPNATSGLVFGAIGTSSCPPSPTFCEDPPKQVRGTARFEQLDTAKGSTALVADTATDGLFNVRLPAGRWLVVAIPVGAMRCESKIVAVASQRTVNLTLSCDAGG